MTKGRDIAAESLESLLEIARRQRRHGLLRAEYVQRGRLEEGEIYLAAGQPIYAHTGRLVGIEALNYLLSWRNIRFSFVTDVPQPPVNIYFSSRQSNTTTPLGVRTQPFTPMRLPVTDGLRWNTQPQPTVQPPSPPVQPPAPPVRASTPGIERMIPYKNGPERDVVSLGLARRLRVIYFLIDGQHSVADLAQTTHKTIQEMEVLLNELRDLGLIGL
jgi:hypothetical protein